MLENEEDKNENLLDSKIDDAIALEVNKKTSLIDLNKSSLIKIGYNKDLVDTIYKNVHPVNVDEALDYLYKNSNNLFTHTYISTKYGKCAICEEEEISHSKEALSSKEIEKKESELLKLDSFHFNYNKFDKFNFVCEVCGDDIDIEDFIKLKLPCKHKFCKDCWLEYLKEKINNGKVYKISCMKHKCNYALEENFVREIIGSNEDLLKKYEKFLTRKKLIDSNKKLKFCPVPDCDGYAEKHWNKYVKCNFGHEFCFDCGEKPHGWKSCSKMKDKGFEEWKSHNFVKRCPYCKFWTEKNEGCNHMTCSQCHFQWCWICEKECVAGHYNFGPCRGMHFESARSKELAKGSIKDYCGLCCIVTWILTNFVYLLIYLFMMPCFYLAVLGLKHLRDTNTAAIVFYSISFLPFFICYEVWSICFIVVASIPAIIIYPYLKFLRYILLGKILGELFPV